MKIQLLERAESPSPPDLLDALREIARKEGISDRVEVVIVGDGRVLHRGFDDPPRLAHGAATGEEALGHYRRVRDEIKEYILALPQELRLSDAPEVRAGRRDPGRPR